MAKKKEIIEEVKKEPESIEITLKARPSKLEFNFGSGDLNVLKDKLNEVIDSLP